MGTDPLACFVTSSDQRSSPSTPTKVVLSCHNRASFVLSGANMICKTLVLALLFSLSVLMHILSCALYENWLPITIGVVCPHSSAQLSLYVERGRAWRAHGVRVACA